MEIERRWLLNGFPKGLTPLQRLEKTQGYLSTQPVVRIRAEYPETGDAQYILCIKGKGTLVREEVELPLTGDTFERLRALLAAPLIRKKMCLYSLPDGHVLECSLVDEGEPGSFYYAEVEFNSVQEAESFIAPDFLGEEKTQDPTFSMSAYWRKKCGATENSSADK